MYQSKENETKKKSFFNSRPTSKIVKKTIEVNLGSFDDEQKHVNTSDNGSTIESSLKTEFKLMINT